jgi:hypothetical protein
VVVTKGSILFLAFAWAEKKRGAEKEKQVSNKERRAESLEKSLPPAVSKISTMIASSSTNQARRRGRVNFK